MKGVKKSHCFDINNTTEILALHYDDFDFELGTAPGNLASLNLSWQSKEGTYCALCLTATCDLCGNGKYGGLADIYQSLEHGARPTRNRRARSTASLQPCGAEAQSSDPVLSAVRLWALRSRKGTIHINDGRAPYISMYGKREGCYTFPQHRPVLTWQSTCRSKELNAMIKAKQTLVSTVLLWQTILSMEIQPATDRSQAGKWIF